MKGVFEMILATAALGTAFLVSGCFGGAPKLTEPGVSMELARERASRISGLSYEISIDIPGSRDSALSGRETVRFRSARGGKVVLDFVPTDFKVISVNGKPARARYVREHIVVPVSKGENSVVIEFTPADRYLNRNDEFLYSLFVPAHARTVFPCFDQPDLKAEYQLTLGLPEGWTAVSNTEPLFQEEHEVIFHKTKPISTYLFAFSAGKWQYEADEETGITAYYRETDPAKLAQLHDIFGEVKMAIAWLEEYTGIPMPFPKYDFVIVPDFQFGGMEHPGCIFFKAATMFLGPDPTPDERARRVELIAHETAHLWFGDMVTMKWFDDVWIKEVFANQMAAKMAQPMFPEIDHELNWLKQYVSLAMAEDRTGGATAIQQHLGNLADAGLIYNNTVYDKTPVMMRKIEEYMGAEAFRDGVCEYLSSFAYSNATWDDLVSVLDRHSDKDIRGFSDVWTLSPRAGNLRGILEEYASGGGDASREAKILLSHDSYLAGPAAAAREHLDSLVGYLAEESNPVVASTIVSCITDPLRDLRDSLRLPVEARLLALSESHSLPSCRLQILRLLASEATAPEVVRAIYDIWLNESNKSLNINDYMSFTYQFALRYPDKAGDILALQRKRIDGSDPARTFNQEILRQFDFVSRAALPGQDALDSLFSDLLKAENRTVEPWASSALALLNHPLRDSSSVKYITPGLEAVQDVKATGDIFFPTNWSVALLGAHRSKEALDELDRFLESHPDYPGLLRNKILYAAYPLQRANRIADQ